MRVNSNDLLTTHERMAISEALGNEALMSGLRKLMICEQRMQEEYMRDEALGACDPNKIIQHAASARAANEFEMIVERNIKRLVPPRSE